MALDLVLDDLVDHRSAAAARAARSAGADDLAAIGRAFAHRRSDGVFADAVAVTDDHRADRSSFTQAIDHTIVKMKFKIIFTGSTREARSEGWRAYGVAAEIARRWRAGASADRARTPLFELEEYQPDQAVGGPLAQRCGA